MDATTLLKNDHDVVRRLFRAHAAAGEDSGERRRVFRTLQQELKTHARVEEEVFYPAVMRVRSEPAREAVREALEDHNHMDGLLAELDQLDPEDGPYGEKMRALQESVEHHIEREEAAMFAQARIHLTDERLERLGHDMAALKGSLGPEPVGAGAAPAKADAGA